MTPEFLPPPPPSALEGDDAALQGYLLWHALFTWRHEAPLHKAARWKAGEFLGMDGYLTLFEAQVQRHDAFQDGELR